MMKKIATLAVTTLLLTGCAGGSGSDAPEPAEQTTAAPAVYTPEQLLAAMPELADVPGGVEDMGRCPRDGEEVCGPDDVDDAVRGLYSVEPTSPVVQSQARATSPATPVDFLGLDGTAHPDEAVATDEIADRRASAEEFEGDFDIPDEEIEDGTAPGERGSGTVRELTIGPWEGFVVDRAVVNQDDPATADPVMLVGQVSLRSGNTVIGAFVSLTAGGRETDAAGRLSESLMRDYIERLG